ncbi:MAG: hypothetical protein VB047_07800 [Anaerotignum propionicum]|jgi:hypothetical protein|uniref:hypothetical protein n=1 Tax=Anaerotignum propionicum TaxID=28446 RepID=UPI002B1F3420|nr:hypothetical protein [Anaerotignum propionicum]MEA5057448.1 hypothetical protein [Anaerotignum propionicum]
MYKKINDFTLNINNEVLNFDYKIKSIVEFEKVYIILLWNIDSDNMADQPLSNVYSIGKNGKVLWNVKPIFQNYNKYTDEHLFIDIQKDDNGNLQLQTFEGIKAIVDPVSGRILQKSWTKG